MAERDTWYLEGFVGGEHVLRRFAVHHERGLCVGRRDCADLCIPEQTVSSMHAELFVREGRLHVRDLGSSNGTFVNRRRIQHETALAEGDSLHFCRNEFRVVRERRQVEDDERTSLTAVHATALPGELGGTEHLHELLARRHVRTLFQPIVALRARDRLAPPFGYELLGRGSHDGLPETPVELFRIAESMGLAARLSTLFREVGLRDGRQLPHSPNLFFNTHPSELDDPGLVAGLRAIRNACPRLELTLEIHEAVLAGCNRIAELRRQLHDLGIGLAYDDFGAGQGRLVMIADTPPDFLKFDRSLISGIDRALPSRQRLLHGLVRNVREFGVRCIAEGVETAGELDLCREMGFAYAQGYHIARPSPLARWLAPEDESPTANLGEPPPDSVTDLAETAVLDRVALFASD